MIVIICMYMKEEQEEERQTEGGGKEIDIMSIKGQRRDYSTERREEACKEGSRTYGSRVNISPKQRRMERENKERRWGETKWN